MIGWMEVIHPFLPLILGIFDIHLKVTFIFEA